MSEDARCIAPFFFLPLKVCVLGEKAGVEGLGVQVEY